MKKLESSILGICLIVGAFGFSGCSEPKTPAEEASSQWTESQNSSPICFYNDYDEGLRTAALENKPLLLFFMEPDCIFSNKMLENTFSNGDIVQLSREFICVQIDVGSSNALALCEQYNISGSPTVQFVSSKGRPLQKITQNQPPEVLRRQMESVLYSIAWRESQTTLR